MLLLNYFLYILHGQVVCGVNEIYSQDRIITINGQNKVKRTGAFLKPDCVSIFHRYVYVIIVDRDTSVRRHIKWS